MAPDGESQWAMLKSFLSSLGEGESEGKRMVPGTMLRESSRARDW